jgi:5-formyltetrahydrofolate cyclo-ligase
MSQADLKKDLRQLLRQRRAELIGMVRIAAHKAMLRHVKRAQLFKKGQKIGLYMPLGFEVDCRVLFQFAAQCGAQIYLPRIAARDQRLWFVPWQAKSRCTRNRFGIEEPNAPRATWRRAQQLNRIFLPLLGFDLQGGRLGMGGGYYDRSLVVRHLFHSTGPSLIGLAYACQQVASLPCAPWDVRLDGVLTEDGLQSCRQ